MTLKNYTVFPPEGSGLKSVMLITGGKKCYEPLFVINSGILSAIIIGSDVTAPSVENIYACIRKLYFGTGCEIISIIPNSAEEVRNFRSATDRALSDNIPTRLVEIGDDCWEWSNCRRRTLVGITYAFKLAGVMAESLMIMAEICDCLNTINMRTISCHLRDTIAFIGTGLDSGTGKYIDTNDPYDVVSEMIDCFKYGPANDKFISIIIVNSYTNNFPSLDTYINETIKQLSLKGRNIAKVYGGHFVSGPHGFSITIMEKVTSELLNYLTTSFPEQNWFHTGGVYAQVASPILELTGPFMAYTDFIDTSIIFACEALISSKNVFNRLDVSSKFGDAITPALNVLLKKTEKKEIIHERPCNLFSIISLVFKCYLEDMYGAMFHCLFSGMSRVFSGYPLEVPVNSQMWVRSLQEGILSVNGCCQFQEIGAFTDVLCSFHSNLENNLSEKNKMVDLLDESLRRTNESLELTYNIDLPNKKRGCPEVVSQMTLVALTAIIQGIRSTMNTLLIEPAYSS